MLVIKSSKVSGVLMGTQRGGDIWVLLCSQRGGGGEENTKFFCEFFVNFWRFGRRNAGQDAKKFQKIRKNSCVPPRCEHSITQMSPRCVARKTFFLLILFVSDVCDGFGLFWVLVGKYHCCFGGCQFVIGPGEPQQ